MPTDKGWRWGVFYMRIKNPVQENEQEDRVKKQIREGKRKAGRCQSDNYLWEKEGSAGKNIKENVIAAETGCAERSWVVRRR
jgi:hypothetical protein